MFRSRERRTPPSRGPFGSPWSTTPSNVLNPLASPSGWSVSATWASRWRWRQRGAASRCWASTSRKGSPRASTPGRPTSRTCATTTSQTRSARAGSRRPPTSPGWRSATPSRSVFPRRSPRPAIRMSPSSSLPPTPWWPRSGPASLWCWNPPRTPAPPVSSCCRPWNRPGSRRGWISSCAFPRNGSIPAIRPGRPATPPR